MSTNIKLRIECLMAYREQHKINPKPKELKKEKLDLSGELNLISAPYKLKLKQNPNYGKTSNDKKIN